MQKIFTILLMSSTFLSLFATESWDIEDMNNFETAYSRYRATRLDRTLDLDGNNCYPKAMDDACGFVADWQLYDSDSVEHGGIIEAETGELREVIQTDNTQESVIIWSLYRNIFESARFDSNTALSWDYISRFPAYDEEISEYSFYYPVWNCGLGMMSVIYYIEASCDSSYLTYGDSCAAFVIDSILPMNTIYPLYNLLHCFVTSYVAGCLANYGEYRDNDYYIEQAESLAVLAMDWAADNPATAYGTEVWAMSAGTFVWGAINSYFIYHPDEFDSWNAEFIDPFYPDCAPAATEFDPYIWDNSWNIWYANGYRALADITDDPLYRCQFELLVDYLIAQDTDFDGGIPSSAFHGDTMDMSWVTTYLVFMGLEGIWDSLAEYDAGAISLEQVGEIAPFYLIGDTIWLEIKAANCGTMPLDETIAYLLCMDDTIFINSYSLTLAEMAAETVMYILETPDTAYFDFFVITALDDSHNNDTNSYSIGVTPITEFEAYMWDSLGSGVHGKLTFYSIYDSTGLLGLFESDSASYMFDITLPEIIYRVYVEPEFPYPPHWIDSVNIADISPTWNINIPNPQVMIIQDDNGVYGEYFAVSLDSIGLHYAVWDRRDGEIDMSMTEPFTWRTILWFTGDENCSTLTSADMDFLGTFIDSGGRVIISGQYITEEIECTDFWTNYICATVTGSGTAIYLSDIYEGFEMLSTGGAGSAGNQSSLDWMIPPYDATSWIVGNAAMPDTNVVAFSRRFCSGGRILFSSLGFEGIGRMTATMETRTELFSKILNWADPAGIRESEKPHIPQAFTIEAYPNPFNSSCVITVNGVRAFRETPLQIEIYDLRGNVVTPYSSRQSRDSFVPLNKGDRGDASASAQGVYIWTPDKKIPTGIYLVRATSGNETITKRIVYLR